MLAAVLGWVLSCQSTPSLLHKWPKGRFGLHAIVDVFVVLAKSKDRALVKTAALVLKIKVFMLGLVMQHKLTCLT